MAGPSLTRGVALLASLILAACVGTGGTAASSSPSANSSGQLASAAPAPATTEPVRTSCVATPPDALGPFYKPGAPVRDRAGSGFLLSGAVLAVGTCRPVAGAVLEFWLANPQGRYDDEHRATAPVGPDGRYRFESNVPVAYGGRPPHIHIRVAAPGREAFVTQFYPRPGQASATFDLVI
jgi:protocatechuate 3,4-dioxygenase beta subunit